MRSFKLALVAGVAGVVVAVIGSGCGSDETDDGGSGGATGSGAAASSSSTGGPVSVSASTGGPASSGTGATGGGGGSGEGVCDTGLTFGDPVFDGCTDANCCASFNPCEQDAACSDCLAEPTAAGCDTNALFQAFDTCRNENCRPGICESMLSIAPQENACLTAECCASFTPCEQDADCNACLLDPTLPTCEDLALYQDFITCRDTSCPTGLCETDIGFFTSYPDFGDNPVPSEPNPTLNACLIDACGCVDMTACADPSGDGSTGQGDAETAACIACLNKEASCVAGAVKTAADAFSACVAASNCQ